MSIVRMRKGVRRKVEFNIGKHSFGLSCMEVIFWLIVVIFIVGAYSTFSGTPGGGGGDDQEGAARKLTRNVATVNGQAISRAEFQRLYAMRADNIPSSELVPNERYLKTSILDSLTQRLLLLAAAKKEGISVSGADVTAKADETVKAQMDQRFPNRKALAKYLQRQKKTSEEYEAELKAELLKDRDALREQVLFAKLEETVKSRVQVSDADLRANYDKVKARHILIRPEALEEADKAKTKDAKTPPATKDYKALARQKADGILARIKKGEDFAKLAMEFSDDPGSAPRGGLLGSGAPTAPGQKAPPDADYFGRGMMDPAFEKVAFDTKNGEVSAVVETQFGFHIIQTLDHKTFLPADFDKKKEDYRKQVTEQKKTQAWTEYEANLKKEAKIEVADPELAAYQALTDGKKDDAVTLLTKAVGDDPQNVGAKYQLATLLRERGDKEQATTLLRELTENEQGASVPQIRMELGDLYAAAKKDKEAIEEYKAASEWASAYDYQSYDIHSQLIAKFKTLKQPALEKAEQDWMAEFMKQQQQSGGMGGGLGGGMPITIPSGP